MNGAKQKTSIHSPNLTRATYTITASGDSKESKKNSISPETLRTALLTLRVYLRFAASIDAADPELHERLILPPEAKRSRDEMLDTEHAENLLEYLAKYEYASAAHVMHRILWETGIRAGTLRGLDSKDYKSEKQALKIEHLPDENTPFEERRRGGTTCCDQSTDVRGP